MRAHALSLTEVYHTSDPIANKLAAIIDSLHDPARLYPPCDANNIATIIDTLHH